jgi:class 3 adenylate cyclase
VIFGDYFLVITALIGTMGAYFLERSQRLLFLRDRQLDRERGRSEGLLRNILPEHIADRLNQRDPATEHGHLAQAVDEVTVVFADLVDFTQQSGRSQPPEIVEVAAQMALAMRDEVQTLRWPSSDAMTVRIGMATGPAVAGGDGDAEVAYDLWGDTVNTAARMESNGVPSEI